MTQGKLQSMFATKDRRKIETRKGVQEETGEFGGEGVEDDNRVRNNERKIDIEPEF